MTAIGTAIRYDQPIPAAFAQPVEPVRPIPSRPERQSDRGDGTGNARRFEYYRDRETEQRTPTQRQERDRQGGNVLPLPGRAQRAPDFTPFIAQQIAQEGLGEEADNGVEIETVDSRATARAAAAYLQASGDSALVLGPVGSRQLVV